MVLGGETIVVVGGFSSKTTGEIVKSRFRLYLDNSLRDGSSNWKLASKLVLDQWIKQGYFIIQLEGHESHTKIHSNICFLLLNNL